MVPALPPTPSYRLSVVNRQYRLAALLVTVGSMAGGMLLLRQMTSAFSDSLMLFYGSSPNSDNLREFGVGSYSLTMAQFAVAVFGLIGALYFALAERRRISLLRRHRDVCKRTNCLEGTARLSRSAMLEVFVLRTSLIAGGLLSYWLFESAFNRFLAGYGFGLGYVEWSSLLPLASIFGLCVIVGMFVATLSMVGIRVILALKTMLREQYCRRHIQSFRVWRRRVPPSHVRTLRERFGTELLSRPPPVVCA